MRQLWEIIIIIRAIFLNGLALILYTICRERIKWNVLKYIVFLSHLETIGEHFVYLQTKRIDFNTYRSYVVNNKKGNLMILLIARCVIGVYKNMSNYILYIFIWTFFLIKTECIILCNTGLFLIYFNYVSKGNNLTWWLSIIGCLFFYCTCTY